MEDSEMLAQLMEQISTLCGQVGGLASAVTAQDGKIDAVQGNLGREIGEFRKENKGAHDGIIERQDKTNGNVTRLERWMYRLLGAGAVLAFLLTLFAILHDHIHFAF